MVIRFEPKVVITLSAEKRKTISWFEGLMLKTYVLETAIYGAKLKLYFIDIRSDKIIDLNAKD